VDPNKWTALSGPFSLAGVETFVVEKVVNRFSAHLDRIVAAGDRHFHVTTEEETPEAQSPYY